MSILLYGCTTWTLTKNIEKKLVNKCTRMLRDILNKSWKQYPTKQRVCGQLPRYVGHCWRGNDELISEVLLWTPSFGRTSVRQPARTYLQQLCTDTGYGLEDLPEAMDDRDGLRERERERELGKSVRATRHDDDDISLRLFTIPGVVVIVVGNGHGDTSSNPGRD